LFEIKHFIEEDLNKDFEKMKAGDVRRSGTDFESSESGVEDDNGSVVNAAADVDGRRQRCGAKGPRKRSGVILLTAHPKRMREDFEMPST
jgi:hypothetical protein